MNYEDILDKADQVLLPQVRMRREDRAAQFSAFAALSGFDGVIAETGRLTDAPVELDATEQTVVNDRLCHILEQLDTQPKICLTWYRPDSRKEGGAFICYTGNLKKLDSYNRLLHFTDGTTIPIDAITEIE